MSALIGITTYGRYETSSFSLHGTYIDAVRAAGAVPVLLPPGESSLAVLLESLDGLIIAGGGDIAPRMYGGNLSSHNYLVDEERDLFEINLARLALKNHIPILGICRGLQILIVASGGTLISHIPDRYDQSIQHRHVDENQARHTIEHMVQIEADSRLAQVLGEQNLSVVSLHHQSANSVPPEWRAVAHSSDGVVEAVEHQDHPWAVGVQWHPELSQNDSSHQRIFQSLVEAVPNYCELNRFSYPLAA